jgi:Na+-driven multidrug efflux pump
MAETSKNGSCGDQETTPAALLMCRSPSSSASSARRPFHAETAALFRLGWPIVLANLLDRSSLWVSTAAIGQHGGAGELGPASLASTVNNVLGTSVNIGLSLAVQTLASQAAGAADTAALRKTLQRSFPVNLLFSLPVMLLLLLLEPLLLLLGRPPRFAAAAAAYGKTILPVAPLVGAQVLAHIS